MKPKSNIIKLVFLLMMLSASSVGFCQCLVPFEQGVWFNIDPATGGITKIQVDHSCNDVMNCGIDKDGNVSCPDPGAPYSLHLWGKCSPSDCDWGAVDGNDHWVSSTKWVYGFYDQGFAKRYVYVKPSVLHPGDLYLWMYSWYADPSRPPRVFVGWFHK